MYCLPYWQLVSAITAIIRPVLYKNLNRLFTYSAQNLKVCGIPLTSVFNI